MPRIRSSVLLLLCGLFPASLTATEQVIFHGKVTLEDGSPPGHLVVIERVCEGLSEPIREGAASGKTGEYYVRLNVDSFGLVSSSPDMYALLPCTLRANDKGFVSSRIDLSDRGVMSNLRLPPLVLTPVVHSSVLGDRGPNVPHAAARNWDAATKKLLERNWAAAETSLRAVVQTAPKFAAGWAALGSLYSNLEKPEDARKALARAIELDPKPLFPYLSLANVEIGLKDWEGTEAASKALIAADSKHVYVEAYLFSAMARYQLHDFDGALSRIDEGIRLDRLRQLTRAEYVLGVILEAKGDLPGAGQHLQAYIGQHPHAKDIAAVNERLANLGKQPIADLSTELTALDLRAAATGEASVPGGIKAFSMVAHLPDASYQDFFLEYCRAITDGGPTASSPTKEAGEEVRVYIATVNALETLGEHRDESTLIRIALGNEEQIRKSRAILAESGWKLVAKGDGYSLEPGDRPNDGLRQWAVACLGVDELALRQAIQEKREFTFEVRRENARLVGGAAWGVLLKGVPDSTGGPIDLFTRDWRFTRVYSGLGAMEGDAAAAVTAALSLNNLIVKYSTPMADFGDAIALSGKRIAVPGGARAEATWAKLAGANPQTPAPFLRALFERDQGRLLAFYYDLTHADAAHQQYFTHTPTRAEAFYKWYRDSAPPSGLPRTPERWQAKVLQAVRFDASGKMIFPGGREVWAGGAESDDDILLRSTHLEALTAVIALEEKREAPLSAPAVQLLTRHHGQWRHLFPYFEKLPGLEAAEFQALADFADATAKAPAARRNLLLGEWHSLVELIVLGEQAGSVTHAQAADFFRRACDAMRSADPSAGAIATLRAMAGGADDMDDALASRLLRLNGARREAFENVKKQQNVPRFETLGDVPDAAKTLAALSGAVYAALLDPAYLLVAEDPQLLFKHNFAPAGTPQPAMFARSWLAVSSEPPGTSFGGGFAMFDDAARRLRRQTVGPLLAAPESAIPPAQREAGPAEDAAAPAPAGDLVFRAGGRVVEVYATVTDSRGRYVDDLSAPQFSILEEGQSKPVFAFENHTAAVSVALVFDTTGSMVGALPPLKSAAMQLVDNLRATDSVAVYSFSDAVTELQPFTSDKEAAKRAILKTHPAGITALYDALVRVNRDLAARGGKKVIIVFTDGQDNASMLTAAAAIERAKARGVPIYTIAEGEALDHPELIAQLGRISQSTGGSQFLIHRLSDIAAVFDKLSQELMHGYLVAFQPSPGDNRAWRRIEVVLSGVKGVQVRAREGFYVE